MYEKEVYTGMHFQSKLLFLLCLGLTVYGGVLVGLSYLETYAIDQLYEYYWILFIGAGIYFTAFLLILFTKRIFQNKAVMYSLLPLIALG
jgi:hypothetical protein